MKKNIGIVLKTGLCIALSYTARGQTTTVAGPRLGYALDRSVHALRPILGIQGASILGDPLDAGFPIRDAAIDGLRGIALAIDAVSGGTWLIHPDQPLPATPVPIAGEAERVYLSPQASAAAFLMHDGRIKILTGISQGTFLVSDVPLGSHVGPAPAAVAVSDDGSLVAAAYGAQALLLGANGARIPLTIGPVSAFAFRPSTSDLVAAGPANKVWLVRSGLGVSSIQEIAGPDDGVSAPAALRFTADGNSVLVANSKNSKVVAVGLTARDSSSIFCGCSAIHFDQLASPNLFLLSDPSSQPIYLFDSKAGRVTFVPPLQSSARQESQD